MNQDEEPHQPEPNTFPVYSRDFLLKPTIVLDHSNKSKRHLEDFIQAFNKRIDTQLTYQKNLNDCAKMLEKYIDPNTEKCVSYISSAFKVDNEQRGNQARQLADSLKTEVIQPLNQTLKKYTNLTKKAEKGFKKLTKDYSYFFENYKRTKENYNENDNQTKDMIITKNIYKYTSEFSQQKKNKLITKTMEGIRQKMQYQKLYKNAVTQFNEAIELYQKEAKQMLNELEQAERQQIKLESDGIRKLIVCEVSMFKNVQYDLINISKQMEKMYAENDIQEFKKEAFNAINQDDYEKDKQIKDLSSKNLEFDKSLLSLSLKNVEQDYYPWLLSIKKNKNLRKIVQTRMKYLNVEKNQQTQQFSKQTQASQKIQQVEKIEEPKEQEKVSEFHQIYFKQWEGLPKQFFNPPPNPNKVLQKLTVEQTFQDFMQLSEIINKIWVFNQQLQGQHKPILIKLLEKNHMMRILAYLFIQQYRIQHKVLMIWDNYESAGELIKLLFDICEKYGDVFTIKGLLGLIFTFYSIKDQKSKRLLYQLPLVGQSELWKRQDYWEASIFQSTYEQMVNFNVQKGETHSETLLRQKNIIFSQLASYCHYMLMLNITSKNVRRIVGRYCRLYEMSEDQNRDLSKMISNTAKQVKQMNNQVATSSFAEGS